MLKISLPEPVEGNIPAKSYLRQAQVAGNCVTPNSLKGLYQNGLEAQCCYLGILSSKIRSSLIAETLYGEKKNFHL